MKKIRISVELSHVTAILVVAGGIASLVMGIVGSGSMRDSVPLNEFYLSEQKSGTYVEGSLDRLVSTPGKTINEDKLFPVAATNALTEVTCYTISIGGGEYITLRVPRGQLKRFETSKTGRIADYDLLAVVKRGLPQEINYEALKTALHLNTNEQVDKVVSTEYFLDIANPEAPARHIRAGLCLMLAGVVFMIAARKELFYREAKQKAPSADEALFCFQSSTSTETFLPFL